MHSYLFLRKEKKNKKKKKRKKKRKKKKRKKKKKEKKRKEKRKEKKKVSKITRKDITTTRFLSHPYHLYLLQSHHHYHDHPPFCFLFHNFFVPYLYFLVSLFLSNFLSFVFLSLL
jgi:hypothetical protein